MLGSAALTSAVESWITTVIIITVMKCKQIYTYTVMKNDYYYHKSTSQWHYGGCEQSDSAYLCTEDSTALATVQSADSSARGTSPLHTPRCHPGHRQRNQNNKYMYMHMFSEPLLSTTVLALSKIIENARFFSAEKRNMNTHMHQHVHTRTHTHHMNRGNTSSCLTFFLCCTQFQTEAETAT